MVAKKGVHMAGKKKVHMADKKEDPKALLEAAKIDPTEVEAEVEEASEKVKNLKHTTHEYDRFKTNI
jgi:hypothetical protein